LAQAALVAKNAFNAANHLIHKNFLRAIVLAATLVCSARSALPD